MVIIMNNKSSSLPGFYFNSKLIGKFNCSLEFIYKDLLIQGINIQYYEGSIRVRDNYTINLSAIITKYFFGFALNITTKTIIIIIVIMAETELVNYT